MIARFKEQLTQLAISSPGTAGKYKLASGIIYKRRLIATGVNSYRSHPMMMNKGYREEQIYLHSEVDVIKNALRLISQDQLAKSSLYIVRVKRGPNKQWVYGNACPCGGCMNLIAQYSIKEVEYTNDEA